MIPYASYEGSKLAFLEGRTEGTEREGGRDLELGRLPWLAALLAAGQQHGVCRPPPLFG